MRQTSDACARRRRRSCGSVRVAFWRVSACGRSSDLNGRGVQTASGGRVVAAELAPDAWLGADQWPARAPGRDRREAEWPAIISRGGREQIRALLASRNVERTSARRYLLGGVLACSHCGERLVARPRSGGQRRYACTKRPGLTGCGKTYINADQVEQFVTEAVLHRADAREVAAPVDGGSEPTRTRSAG